MTRTLHSAVEIGRQPHNFGTMKLWIGCSDATLGVAIMPLRRLLLQILVAATLGSGPASAQKAANPAPLARDADHGVFSAEELFRRVSPSVFVVLSLDGSNHAVEQGSAVVIGKGLLETNYHVIKDGVSFEVRQGPKKWPATLVATSPDRDVAELRVEKLDAPAVSMRPFSSLAIGEHVYAIGAPEGLELTLSEGLISSLRQSGDDRVIQTTSAISPGSSGGGLFDTSGRLVGITVAYLKEGQNLNFALPTDSISSVRSATEWAQLGSAAYEAASEKFNESGKYEAGAFSEALDDYGQALRINPRNESVWRAVGDIWESSGLDLSWTLLGAKPRLAESRNALKRAISAYQRALQLNADDAEAWRKLADAYVWNASDSKEGIWAYKQALRLRPNDIVAWDHLALTYSDTGQDEDALAAYDTIQALIRPDDEGAWKRLGASLLMAGGEKPPFLERASHCYQRALKLQPTDVEAWNGLGQVYASQKDRAGVMKVYEKLRALDPKAASDFFQKYVLPHQQ